MTHLTYNFYSDIKPDNVLLMVSKDSSSSNWRHINTSNMTAKLADFGCGRKLEEADSQSHSMTIVGNTEYWAPEIRTAKMKNLQTVKYSRKSDMWSLAVLAYYCLTGRVPGKQT